MVVTAWIIGIVIFIFSLISLWGTGFLLLLILGGIMAIMYYTGFDPMSSLSEDEVNMFVGAFMGPWALILLLTGLGRIVGFVDDVGKAVRNLADDDRRN